MIWRQLDYQNGCVGAFTGSDSIFQSNNISPKLDCIDSCWKLNHWTLRDASFCSWRAWLLPNHHHHHHNNIDNGLFRPVGSLEDRGHLNDNTPRSISFLTLLCSPGILTPLRLLSRSELIATPPVMYSCPDAILAFEEIFYSLMATPITRRCNCRCAGERRRLNSAFQFTTDIQKGTSLSGSGETLLNQVIRYASCATILQSC